MKFVEVWFGLSGGEHGGDGKQLLKQSGVV